MTIIYLYAYTDLSQVCLVRKDFIKDINVLDFIVSQAYREPIPGWSNTFTGAMGVGVSLSMGAIKIVNKSPDCQIHLIPVDMVANCIIAVAWRTATDRYVQNHLYS